MAQLYSDFSIINSSFQSKNEIYKNKYLAGDTWSYIGPSGIYLTSGYWLISYQIRFSSTATRMDCSIRSTLNNSHVQTVTTNDKNLITSIELTEIVGTGNVNNLYPQVYVPANYTFSELWVGTTCIKLK